MRVATALLAFFAFFAFSLSNAHAANPDDVAEVAKFVCEPKCQGHIKSGYLGAPGERCFVKIRMREIGKQYSVVMGSKEHPTSIALRVQEYPFTGDALLSRRVEDIQRRGKPDICSRGTPSAYTPTICDREYLDLYDQAIRDLLHFVRQNCSPATTSR